MKIKEVWRDEAGNLRLTKPDDEEGWTRIPVTDLKPAERATVKLDELGESFTAQIAAQQREIDELKAQMFAAGGPKKDKEEPIQFTRLFRAIKKGGDLKDYEDIKRIVRSPQARALASQIDTDGGYIVPFQYMPEEFIEALYHSLILGDLGARTLTGLVGSPVAFPKLTGSATWTWTGENASITESQQTVGQVLFRPRKLGALVKMANELVGLSNPSVETMVRMDLGEGAGEALQLAALDGSGSEHQPLGILGLPSPATYTPATKMTRAVARGAVHRLVVEKALRGRLGFAISPEDWLNLENTAADAGEPKFGDGAGVRIADNILGYPSRIATQLEQGSAIFGNWSDLIIAQWGGIVFAASSEAGEAFQFDQTWIRGKILADVNVRREKSFVVISGLSS